MPSGIDIVRVSTGVVTEHLYVRLAIDISGST